MADIVQASLRDSGTRWQHYSELVEWWELALHSLEDLSWKSNETLERIKQLREGIGLLKKQIGLMSGFEDGLYGDALYPLKLEIDRIPKDPAEIIGGRGEEN